MKKCIYLLIVICLFAMISSAAKCQSDFSGRMNTADEQTERENIYDYFARQEIKIKTEDGVPLIVKDDGIYGGMERWRITLENGDMFLCWIKDEKITYVLGGKEFNGIPLSDIPSKNELLDLESLGYWELWDLSTDIYYELFKREMANGNDWHIHQGIYSVGKDLPAGTYKLENYSLFITDNILVTVYEPEGNVKYKYVLSSDAPIGKLELCEGETIEIKNASVNFSPYIGAGI